jgi:Tfp pilus assembly protein PilF
MPLDPRPHEWLAELYAAEKKFERAETAYRAAIEREPRQASRYYDLAGFFIRQSRFEEAVKTIDQAETVGGDADEMFSDLIASCSEGEEDVAEKFAASQPARMSKNAAANLQLGYLRLNRDQAAKAMESFKKAAELKPDLTDAHTAISSAHRKLRNYRAALASAERAIKLDAEDGGAHYNRACALARLGRRAEAITALKRAIELDEYYGLDLEEEEDLKPLSSMPEFKKLVEGK